MALMHETIEARRDDDDVTECRASPYPLEVPAHLDTLYALPIVSVAKVGEWTGLSRPANTLVREFVRIGILRQRNLHVRYRRDFEYRDYLRLFTSRRAYFKSLAAP
jgi:hypothetical protein